jgi:hypothetical protein
MSQTDFANLRGRFSRQPQPSDTCIPFQAVLTDKKSTSETSAETPKRMLRARLRQFRRIAVDLNDYDHFAENLPNVVIIFRSALLVRETDIRTFGMTEKCIKPTLL